MIDSRARSKLAEAARALVAGRITNDQFEDRVPRSDDPAIREIFAKGFWRLYGDLTEHRLVDAERLGPEKRAFAARCILFLKSGHPYGWPVHSRLGVFGLGLLNLLTLGLFGRVIQRRLLASGNAEVWPFRTDSEYNAALGSPPYLHGLSPNNSFKPKPLRGSA